MLIDTDDMVSATMFNRSPGKYVDAGADGGRPVIVKDNVPVAFVGSMDDLRRLQAMDNVDPTAFAFTGPTQMPTGRSQIGRDPGGGRVWIKAAGHVLAVGERGQVLDTVVSAALGRWLHGVEVPTELLIGTSGFVSPVIRHTQTAAPTVQAVVTDLDEESKAHRFAQLINGHFEARKQLLIGHGVPSLGQHRSLLGEEAVPDLVVATHLCDTTHASLLVALKQLVRRGPELGMYLWMFSEKLPEWVDPLDFSQRIAFRVRSAHISRQLVDTPAAALLAPESTDGYLLTPELETACRVCIDPPDLDEESGYQLDKYSGSRASVMDEPVVLEQLAAEHAEANNVPDVLSWPIGYSDDPALFGSRGVKYFSTTDAHQTIIGRPGSGRSTALQTIVLSGASRYSPTQLGFYIINPGGPLEEIGDLPHIGGIGRSPDENSAILSTLWALVQSRTELCHAHGVGLPGPGYQRRRAQEPDIFNDNYPPDMFLIIDGLKRDKSSDDWPGVVDMIVRLARCGRWVGVHVVVSTDKRVELGSVYEHVIPWELKLLPEERSVIQDGSPAKLVPDDQPGRGIDFGGHQIRFAICSSTTGIVTEISGRFATHRPVPPANQLPDFVDSADLTARLFPAEDERYAIGIIATPEWQQFSPRIVDFNSAPLMAVYGDSDSGRTEFLAHMLDAIARRHPDSTDATIIVVDIQRKLLRTFRDLPRDTSADHYVTDVEGLTKQLNATAELLSGRRPPAELTADELSGWQFEGHPVYLVIEDLALVPSNASTAPSLLFTPLQQLIPNSRELGLRIIAGRAAMNVSAAEFMPGLLNWMTNAGKNTLMLRSQARTEKVNGSVRFEHDIPTGRAKLLDTKGFHEQVQLAARKQPPG